MYYIKWIFLYKNTGESMNKVQRASIFFFFFCFSCHEVKLLISTFNTSRADIYIYYLFISFFWLVSCKFFVARCLKPLLVYNKTCKWIESTKPALKLSSWHVFLYLLRLFHFLFRCVASRRRSYRGPLSLRTVGPFGPYLCSALPLGNCYLAHVPCTPRSTRQFLRARCRHTFVK